MKILTLKFEILIEFITRNPVVDLAFVFIVHMTRRDPNSRINMPMMASHASL